MKVINADNVKPEEVNMALFTGTVTRQTLIPAGESDNFNMSIVNFPRGVRNKLHAHSCDQILIVTAGYGTVATEGEENVVGVGDIIHIPAGEKHWHGAGGDSDFSHITITMVGVEITQFEE